MKDIIILGTAGNCIDILDTINSINNSVSKKIYNVLGFLDDDESKYLKKIYDKQIIGKLADAYKYPDAFFINGIGSVKTFFLKSKILKKTKLLDERFETIIHPSAVVSTYARIDVGTVVFQNVVVTSNASIGKQVIILPNSVVNHDVIVGDYSCITSGVLVSGAVSIGNSCYIGTGSCINNSVQIADNCLIGMGSAVIHDTQANSVYYGVPAKFVRKLMTEGLN